MRYVTEIHKIIHVNHDLEGMLNKRLMKFIGPIKLNLDFAECYNTNITKEK